MATPGVIIDLRKALAERFPQRLQPATTILGTGIPFLDQITGGGFPKSAITELISPRASAGSASLIHSFLRSAHRDQHFVALIDGSDSFDPGSSDNSALHHLLWVRCSSDAFVGKNKLRQFGMKVRRVRVDHDLSLSMARRICLPSCSMPPDPQRLMRNA